jgi:hypothetical protein
MAHQPVEIERRRCAGMALDRRDISHTGAAQRPYRQAPVSLLDRRLRGRSSITLSSGLSSNGSSLTVTCWV